MDWICLICEKSVKTDPGSTGSLKPACWPCVEGGTVEIHFGFCSRFDDMNGIVRRRGVTHQAVICDDCYEKKQRLTRSVVPCQTAEWKELPRNYRDAGADEPEYIRAGGGVVCEACGKTYYDHPQHNEFSFLNVLCDGTVVKL